MKMILFAMALLLSQSSYSNQIRSSQIRDGGVHRVDLNTDETGNAVILRILAGDDIDISSTGIDSGTGDVTVNTGIQVAKRDEVNTFLEDQVIFDNTNPLLFFADSNNRLVLGYNEAVNYTPGRTGNVSAEVISDRNGDIHYSTRPASSSLGHRFYTSVAGVLDECFRIASTGIDGLMKQAKNFADPTVLQDLVTMGFSDRRDFHRVIQRIDVLINDTNVLQSYINETIAVPEQGDYLVSVWVVYSHDSVSNDIFIDSTIDGQNYRFIREEFQDSAGVSVAGINVTTGAIGNSGTDQIRTATNKLLLSDFSGDLSLDLEWRAQTSGNESTIHRAIIEVKRVNI